MKTYSKYLEKKAKVFKSSYSSAIPLGTESRLSPKLVNSMSSGVPVPSLGHLFLKLE